MAATSARYVDSAPFSDLVPLAVTPPSWPGMDSPSWNAPRAPSRSSSSHHRPSMSSNRTPSSSASPNVSPRRGKRKPVPRPSSPSWTDDSTSSRGRLSSSSPPLQSFAALPIVETASFLPPVRRTSYAAAGDMLAAKARNAKAVTHDLIGSASLSASNSIGLSTPTPSNPTPVLSAAAASGDLAAFLDAAIASRDPVLAAGPTDYVATLSNAASRLSQSLRRRKGKASAAHSPGSQHILPGSALLASLEQLIVSVANQPTMWPADVDCMREGLHFMLVLIEAQTLVLRATTSPTQATAEQTDPARRHGRRSSLDSATLLGAGPQTMGAKAKLRKAFGREPRPVIIPSPSLTQQLDAPRLRRVKSDDSLGASEMSHASSMVARLLQDRQSMQREVEELSAAVFAEANAMVKAERQQNAALKEEIEAMKKAHFDEIHRRPSEATIRGPTQGRAQDEYALAKAREVFAPLRRREAAQQTSPAVVARSRLAREQEAEDLAFTPGESSPAAPSSYAGSPAVRLVDLLAVEQTREIAPKELGLPQPSERRAPDAPSSPQSSDSDLDDFKDTEDFPADLWIETHDMRDSPRRSSAPIARVMGTRDSPLLARTASHGRLRASSRARNRSSLPPRAPEPSSPLPDRPDGTIAPPSPIILSRTGSISAVSARGSLLRSSAGSSSDQHNSSGSSSRMGGLTSSPSTTTSEANHSTDSAQQATMHWHPFAMPGAMSGFPATTGLGVTSGIEKPVIPQRMESTSWPQPPPEEEVMAVQQQQRLPPYHPRLPHRETSLSVSSSIISSESEQEQPRDSRERPRVGRARTTPVAAAAAASSSPHDSVTPRVSRDRVSGHGPGSAQSSPALSSASKSFPPLSRETSRTSAATGTSSSSRPTTTSMSRTGTASSIARSTKSSSSSVRRQQQRIDLQALGVTSPPVASKSKYTKGSRSRILGHSTKLAAGGGSKRTAGASPPMTTTSHFVAGKATARGATRASPPRQTSRGGGGEARENGGYGRVGREPSRPRVAAGDEAIDGRAEDNESSDGESGDEDEEMVEEQGDRWTSSRRLRFR